MIYLNAPESPEVFSLGDEWRVSSNYYLIYSAVISGYYPYK